MLPCVSGKEALRRAASVACRLLTWALEGPRATSWLGDFGSLTEPVCEMGVIIGIHLIRLLTQYVEISGASCTLCC